MNLSWEVLALSVVCLARIAAGFGGSEEKFIKKYAMMKVYESCFGSHVLKEIRREMKEAAQKCSGFQPDFDDKYINHEALDAKPSLGVPYGDKPFRVKPTAGNKVKKPIHTTDTLLLQQWADEQKLTDASDDSANPEEGGGGGGDAHGESAPDADGDSSPPAKKPIDLSKLEEAIMNIGRPAGQFGHPRPGFPAASSAFHQPYYPPMYFPPAVPFAAPPPAHSYPYHAYYPGFYQPQAGAPGYPPYYRASRRSPKITKDFDARMRSDGADIRAQIDAMTFHSGAKMRNITCVMQELGYLDDHLEPNYERIMERIGRLDVPDELRRDMIDGVKFCRQFSQCVPETRKDKFQLSKELLRPMFFFRCYKHKKLESCIMKDVRERFSQASADESNLANNELQRSFKNNDLATAMFEFMYGTNSEDVDGIL